MRTVRNILHVLKKDWEKFETDPYTQLKYHRRMVIFWLANFPIIALLYFGLPKVWVGVGLVLNTFYSLYANLDTEMGDAHGAYASLKADELVNGDKPDKLPPAFQNPAYRPPSKKLIADVLAKNDDLIDLKSNDIASDEYLEMLAKDEADTANF